MAQNYAAMMVSRAALGLRYTSKQIIFSFDLIINEIEKNHFKPSHHKW